MTTKPHKFARTKRLAGKNAFARAYDARVRQSWGPLTLYAAPNELGHWRLGISIGRKAGTAPRRNRIKRLLREAFRMIQHDLPEAYDLVVVARGHEPLALDQYRQMMVSAGGKLHASWVSGLGSRVSGLGEEGRNTQGTKARRHEATKGERGCEEGSAEGTAPQSKIQNPQSKIEPDPQSEIRNPRSL